MGEILFLAHRVPFPPDRGDKIRAYNLLKYLAGRTRVHLATFADDRRDLNVRDDLGKAIGSRAVVWRGKPTWLAAVQALLTGQPVSITAFASAAMHRAVADVLARRPIDTIVAFSSQMAQYIPVETKARVVIDFCDVDSAKFAEYGRTAGGLKGWMMRREAKLLLAHDRAVAERADASLFISPAEAQVFADATELSDLHVLENGIDTAKFDPAGKFAVVEGGNDLIVFTGQMDYAPNIEAVVWFAEDILPLVRVQRPDARFAIVGRNPTPVVTALAKLPEDQRFDLNLTDIAEVADVRGWLAAAAVVVAPLKLARGVQNKVLEAMAMARPVVASAAAAEGIDHAGTIRVGVDAETLAAGIVTLLTDRDQAAKLGAAARARVIERYGWATRLAPLDELAALAKLPEPARAA